MRQHQPESDVERHSAYWWILTIPEAVCQVKTVA